MLRSNRLVTLEVEVEHPEMSEGQLTAVRKELRQLFPGIITVHDYSLANGGIELIGKVTEPWKEVIDFLVSRRFRTSSRTGLHIHVDVRSQITGLDGLRRLIAGIWDVQLSAKPLWKRMIAPYRKPYPMTMLKKLYGSPDLFTFSQTLFNEANGYEMVKTEEDLVRNLNYKQFEHAYWIDITPILRFLWEMPRTKMDTGIIGGYGSVEFRGSMPAFSNKEGAIVERDLTTLGFFDWLRDLLILTASVLSET